MKKVILLRRDERQLTEFELAFFKEKFGEDLQFVRTDPADYKEHVEDCRRLLPVFISILERPIESVAMENDWVHVTVVSGPDGPKMMRLLRFIPEFENIPNFEEV